MRIADLARERLAHLPTPFTFLPTFSSALEGPDIWIKRDDLTGLAGGGNKARKLEFITGDARRKGADTLLTAGGLQSNHARMTAAAAAALGMDAVLFLSGEDPGYRQGNLLLDELLGAEAVYLGEGEDYEVPMEEWAERLRGEGRSPYLIPVGGSVPLGCAGYALAVLELVQQAIAAGVTLDHVVVSSGSGGTAAGLLLALAHLSPCTVLHAVLVSRSAEEVRQRILELAEQAAVLLEWPCEHVGGNLEVHDDFIGPGYAIATPEGVRAGLTLARTEGILVDTTYTGKGLSGLVGLIDRGRIGPGETAVFLHTGGVPAIFNESHQGTFDSVWRK